MTTYVYERVEYRFQKNGTCPICGRSVRRSTTFGQTINPFNKNPDGSLKDRQQIWTELTEEAKAWQPDFTHSTHKETA